MGILDRLIGRNKKEENIRVLGKKLSSRIRTHHHDILEAVLKSGIIITEPGKLRDLLKKEGTLTFLIPEDRFAGNIDMKSDLLKVETKKGLEAVLHRAVLAEDLGGLGVLIAFEKRPNEDLADIKRVISQIKTRSGVEKHIVSALERPITEEMAAKIISRMPRKTRVGGKIIRIKEGILRKRLPKTGFASRVTRRTKPV